MVKYIIVLIPHAFVYVYASVSVVTTKWENEGRYFGKSNIIKRNLDMKQ